MFDISFSELLLIGVVALLVIGPERLPKVARTVGHLLGRAQRYVNDVKSDIQREVELDDLRNMKEEMESAAHGLRDSFHDAAKSMKDSVKEPLQSLKDDLEATKESLNRSIDPPTNEKSQQDPETTPLPAAQTEEPKPNSEPEQKN